MNDWNKEQGIGEKSLNREFFAKTEWSKDDIATLATDEDGVPLLTDEEIDDFIQTYEGRFVDRIIEQGWDTWSYMLNDYKAQKKRLKKQA